MRRIVLLIPNTRWFGKRPWVHIPYAALILTGILKHTFDFRILDANSENLEEDQCRKQLVEMNPEIIMVTAGSVEYHLQVHLALDIARNACPVAATILGGVYPTTLPEEAAKDTNADWLFMYHAEDRIVPFLELLVQNPERACTFPGIAYRNSDDAIVVNPVTSHIGDVKTMAKPDYSLMNVSAYLKHTTLDYQFNSPRPTAFIITSFGCPYNCVFCAARTISGKRVVFRPLEDIVEEIEYLMQVHQVGNLIFVDDAFLADQKRINQLMNIFMERSYNLTWKVATVSAWDLNDDLLEMMARSGCSQITVSVESGSQRVLKEVIHKPLKLEIIPHIVKKCREVGIDAGANFVIGIPGETWEEIRQSFKFAEECDFDVAHFHIATPLPQTDMYRICKENGYLPEDFSFLDSKFFGFCEGFITTDEFTPFELMVLRAFEWDRINFSTPEKTERVARLYGTTVEKLHVHRQQTRRKLGVHF